MNTRSILAYGSVLVVLVGSLVPLITLRSFPGYIDAWISLLVFLAPAYLLVALILLSRRLSPVALTRTALSFLALLTLGFVLGRVFLWFLLIFALGAAILIWASLKTNQTKPRAP